jgi:hypothetical protein
LTLRVEKACVATTFQVVKNIILPSLLCQECPIIGFVVETKIKAGSTLRADSFGAALGDPVIQPPIVASGFGSAGPIRPRSFPLCG